MKWGARSALAARKRLSGSHFKCIHYESNDARGIDVGVFYRSDKFKLIGSEPVKLVLRSGREYIGRNILAMWGELDGEMFAVYGNGLSPAEMKYLIDYMFVCGINTFIFSGISQSLEGARMKFGSVKRASVWRRTKGRPSSRCGTLSPVR